MKILRDTRLFYLRKVRETLRNPIFLIMGVMLPIMYLSFFAPLIKGMRPDATATSVLNSFVPGMLVLIAVFNGIFAGFSIIDELRSGIIERFRVSPASRFAILAGPVLRDATATIIQLLFLIAISLPFGFSPSLPGILLLLPLLLFVIITTSAWGNTMGLIVKSEDKFAPIVQGVNMPVLLLSGMLIPMSYGPPWLNTVAHFNPIFYVVEASRFLILGDIFNIEIAQAYLIATSLMIVTLLWGAGVVRKVTS